MSESIRAKHAVVPDARTWRQHRDAHFRFSSRAVAFVMNYGCRFQALTLWLGVGLLVLIGSSNALAQNYRFAVSEMDLQVFVQPDASARIEYRILFRNQPGAHAIDIVDIGLPHSNYSISNMSASVDGKPLRTIRKSSYIDVGAEVHLGSHQIRGGQQGTFRFEATMPDMVYQDTTDESRASLQMIPTWFDPQLQVGTTRLKMAVHLPPGVTAEEVTYQNEQDRYQQMVLFGEGDQQHIVAGWDYPNHFLSKDNPKIGISFPKRGMNRVVTISTLGLLVKWFSEHEDIQFFSGAALTLLLIVTFLRFSHGTGWVLLLMLCGGLIFTMIQSPGLHLSAWLPMLGLFAWNERVLWRRKSSYLPAIAQVEGGGIKRGLTAPQAAVLLELPLGKVLTLVIFGMLKKGLVTMTSAEPLTVRVAEGYRGSRKQRTKAASKAGVVIHNYEHPFLYLLARNEGTPIEAIRMQVPLKELVETTAKRMEGFDVSQTVAYYRRIVERAWREAESIPKVELRTDAVDRNLDWMMIDPDWSGRFDSWGPSIDTYQPRWTTTHSSGRAPSAPSPSTPSTPTTSKTSFGEVASSFAGWAENTSNHFASAIEPGSLGFGTPGGIVDLSGVDRVTADVFKALGEAAQNSGGSGGGGGCACACAGCACACACAGGGR